MDTSKSFILEVKNLVEKEILTEI